MLVRFGEPSVYIEEGGVVCVIGHTHIEFPDVAVNVHLRFYGDVLVIKVVACTLGKPIQGSVNGYAEGAVPAGSRDYGAIEWIVDEAKPQELSVLAVSSARAAMEILAGEIGGFIQRAALEFARRIDVEAELLVGRLSTYRRLRNAAMAAV